MRLLAEWRRRRRAGRVEVAVCARVSDCARGLCVRARARMNVTHSLARADRKSTHMGLHSFAPTPSIYTLAQDGLKISGEHSAAAGVVFGTRKSRVNLEIKRRLLWWKRKNSNYEKDLGSNGRLKAVKC